MNYGVSDTEAFQMRTALLKQTKIILENAVAMIDRVALDQPNLFSPWEQTQILVVKQLFHLRSLDCVRSLDHLEKVAAEQGW